MKPSPAVGRTRGAPFAARGRDRVRGPPTLSREDVPERLNTGRVASVERLHTVNGRQSSSDGFHRQNNLAAYRSQQTHVSRTDGFRFRQVATDQNAGDGRIL